jgi:hypothetical protein
MEMNTLMQYIDESTGATADSVYITDAQGNEIASVCGRDWNEALIDRLAARYGIFNLRATFEGGTLDGYEAI